MNLNSPELLLNWPLCEETPDGKCLFLSLSAIKAQTLTLNSLCPGYLDVVFCKCSRCLHVVPPASHSQCGWTLSGRKTAAKLYWSSFNQTGDCSVYWNKARYCNTVLNNCFFSKSRETCAPVINLFTSWRLKSWHLWWAKLDLNLNKPCSGPSLATVRSLEPIDQGVNLPQTGGKGLW